MTVWYSNSFLTIAVAAVFAMGGCGGKEQRLAAHLEKGRAFHAAGDLEKARVEIKNVLQMDPKVAEAYFISGLIEMQQKEWQKAYANFTRTIELAPGHPQATLHLGRLYLLGGDPGKALRSAEEVLAKRSDDPAALTLKAAVLANNGDAAAAKIMISEVISRDPAQSDAVALLAGMLVSQRLENEATEVLTRGIAANPKNPDLRLALISIHLSAREFNKAEEQYAALIAGKPDELPFRVGLAQLQATAGDVDKAEATLRQAIAVKPDDDARYLMLADFLVARRGREVAEKFLVETLKARPGAGAVQFSLASLYRGAGESAKAEAVYRDILSREKLSPDGLNARGALAELRASRGRPDEAAALIAEILKTNPRDNQALMLRGRMALDRGDALAAIGDFRAVLRDQPNAVPVITQLARAHLANGEQELARETLGKAATLFPDQPEVRMLMAEFKAGTRDLPGAREEIDHVLKQNPSEYRALFLKSDIEAAAGDWKAAEATLIKFKKSVPGDPRIDQKLGNLYAAQKRFDQALAAYESALTVVPGAIEPLTGLSNIYLAQGKPQRAVDRTEAVLKVSPDNFLAQALLGRLESANQRHDNAQAAFRKAVAMQSGIPGTHVELANYLASRGDFSGAEKAVKDGLAVLPGDEALTKRLADVYLGAGKTDQAIAVFEEMLTRDSGNDLAANNLASLLLDYREDKSSHERARGLVQRFERSRNPAYLDSLGWAHFKLGEYERAVPVLKKALDNAPQAAVLHFHLGMALHKKGDVSAAKLHLQKAVDAKVEFPGIGEAKKILSAG
ncbi:MAG: tetratricopeptide repeat protein [Burkholderiales bacterium]